MKKENYDKEMKKYDSEYWKSHKKFKSEWDKSHKKLSKFALIHENETKEINKKIDKLGLIYAKENNLYKIGDIIKDKYGTKIKITEIKYVVKRHYTPHCVYSGRKLYKNNKPTKKDLYKVIYQDNTIELIEI